MTLNLQGVKKVLERRAIPGESYIFREGEHAQAAFIVTRGKVRITTKGADGNEITLTEVGEGQMFGELALMSPDSRRTASAYAPEPCEVMVISQAKLKERLDAADSFVKYWIEYLSKRVIDLTARAKDPK
jgi:CRP-like cAMP-binding protein